MSPKPLRILCVTPWFPNTATDGRYNFIRHSIDALLDLGQIVRMVVTRPWVPWPLHSVSVDWTHSAAAIEPSLLSRLAGTETVRYPSIPRYVLSEHADALYRFGAARAIERALLQHAPDVVHAHTERAGNAAVPIARRHGVPSVVTLHGIDTAPQILNSAPKRDRLRRTLRGADRVALVGEPLREHFARLAGSDGNFRVVPNGFILTSATLARPRRAGEPMRCISVSKLAEGKGVDLNLRALAGLDAQGIRDWSYVVVGDGPERPALERLARELRIDGRVDFRGELDHDSALALLAGAHVFVLPSYREAFGVAYLEAMAAGLLVIGVRDQGPAAFIRSGFNGVLVDPQGETSVRETLRFAYVNPDETAAIAAAGRETATTEFTWARHAEKLTAVFREAAGA